VVDHIVEHLASIGIDYIFGVDGANIEDLYDAAHFRSDIIAVLAKHEFSAATMADGYSRSGAGLGVVAATSGGGALNLVAGLGESLTSRVPVLALVGQPATTMDGRGSFQDTSGRNGSLNAETLFSAVSVFCRRVLTPADIISALPHAIAAARSGGPAVLLLPKNIQQSMVGVNGYAGNDRRGFERPTAGIGDPHPIVRALRRANGPVTIIAGEQVARDDARAELEELRTLLRAQVACVPDAKDVAGTPGSGSSSALGVTGVMGHPGVADAVAASAVCLVVGTRLSVTARTGLDDAFAAVRTVSIGSAPPYLPCTHVHTQDLRGSLTMLTRALSGRGRRPTGLRVPDFVTHTELSPPPFAGTGVRYRDAMIVLDRMLPDGTDIVVDAGNTGAAAIHYLPVRRDGRFAVALGMGGMGYSFGAGIGMAFGRANDGHSRRTVVIAGDGAFFMHGMEVHTAVQYRLPVTFILFNNNAHAMCVTREQLLYDDLYSYNRFRPSNLGAGLAAMFPGLSSVDVADIDALPAALERAMAVDGPSVVTVECSADEIPPFAAFLNRLPANQVVEQQITTLRENRFHVPSSA
jgi:acetolactate synthase I/II/III large subunit